MDNSYPQDSSNQWVFFMYNVGMTLDNTKGEIYGAYKKALKSYQVQLMAVQSWEKAYYVMEDNFVTRGEVIHNLEKEVKKLTHPGV